MIGAFVGGLLALAVLALPSRGQRARDRLRSLRSGLVPGSDWHVEGFAEGSVEELAEQLAAAFRAGLPPARAWAALAAQPGPFAGLATRVEQHVALGLPAGRALREATGAPDAIPLAVALDLCERSGAPAAQVLDALAAGMRAEAAAALEIRVALAAPAATTTVMSLLPVAGIGLGALLGADTVRVLVATTSGRVCLAVGAALWIAGRRWMRALVAAAGRAGEDRE